MTTTQHQPTPEALEYEAETLVREATRPVALSAPYFSAATLDGMDAVARACGFTLMWPTAHTPAEVIPTDVLTRAAALREEAAHLRLARMRRNVMRALEGLEDALASAAHRSTPAPRAPGRSAA